jgi:hypothetical protein
VTEKLNIVFIVTDNVGYGIRRRTTGFSGPRRASTSAYPC